MEIGNTWDTSSLTDQQETAVADINRFPTFKRDSNKAIAPQIAQHLVLLLRHYTREAQPTSLRIPSAISLTSFYHCTALDVLDGLYAFRQKNYEYIMNGLDADITLCGHPHILKTRTVSLWRNPWDITHKIAECPLVNLFQGKAG